MTILVNDNQLCPTMDEFIAGMLQIIVRSWIKTVLAIMDPSIYVQPGSPAETARLANIRRRSYGKNCAKV